MPGYDIGPFQNIVGVGWGSTPVADFMVAYFKLTYYADDERYQCASSPNMEVYITFATSVQLIPNVDAAAHDGLYFLQNASGSVPLSDITYSGVPAYPPSVPSPGLYDWRLNNILTFYDADVTVFGGDQIIETIPSSQPILAPPGIAGPFDRSLTSTWVCKNWPFVGEVFCGVNGWYDKGTDYSLPLSARETIASAELDFSNFSIMHTPTGKVYDAYSSKVSSDGIGQNVFTVLCIPSTSA